MNILVKVSCDNFDAWKKEFEGHKERANVCDESKTTVGKIDDKHCIVMLYDVDMEGLQKLMMSDYLQQLTKDLNIVNEEMHSFEPLPAPE
tara:strand:- start:1034 stop:1303 length:270 start_codon:yes stop_codon:yes gene_type:complete